MFVLLSTEKEIGGYFGFDFDVKPCLKFPYPNAVRYCSARAAFYDLVKNLDIQAIWMPKFICNSMLAPLELLGINIKFYDLDHNFFPILDEKINKSEYLLYINYFGIFTQNQKKLLDIYPRDKLIFDHSQAFFLAPFENVHTLYSIRKFLPVADGGLLVTKNKLNSEIQATLNFEQTIEQYHHLFKRSIFGAQVAYDDFQRAERKFEDCIPRVISPLTEIILEDINYNEYKEKRLENFKFLHSKLEKLNYLSIDIEDIESPLTYPFLWKHNFIEEFTKNKVYSPTYWIDCLSRINKASNEYIWLNQLTHLVCDHRYSIQDMQYQIDLIMEFL